MYIRGRAINAHAPSNFKEPKNAGQAPDATMELDWMYPCFPYALLLGIDLLQVKRE